MPETEGRDLVDGSQVELPDVVEMLDRVAFLRIGADDARLRRGQLTRLGHEPGGARGRGVQHRRAWLFTSRSTGSFSSVLTTPSPGHRP